MAEFFNQPSFAAGEIAPALYGRVDQDLYYIALRTCLNCIVRKEGGATKRPGTTLSAEARYANRKLRLIPFQFNEVQTYVIELGHLYMRIIKDGAEVLDPSKAIVSISSTNPALMTVTAHGWSNGDDIYVGAVPGVPQASGRIFRVANATTNGFELHDLADQPVDGTAWSSYTAGGTVARIYTVATPWTEDQLFGINYTQSNDVITLVHNDVYPRDVTRSAHASWSVNLFLNKEGPFKDTNISATTVYASAATGTGITMTASAALFDATMVGELFYIQQTPTDTTPTWEVGKPYTAGAVVRAGANYYSSGGGTSGTLRPSHTDGTLSDGSPGVNWTYLHSGFGIVKITAFTDSTHVTADVVKQLPDRVVGSGNATAIWARAAWSASEGYPAAVVYNKQRLWFGGTKMAPSTIWASGTALRTSFGVSNPTLDDEAITLQLDTADGGAIRQLMSLKSLLALTSKNEQLINSASGAILATEPPVADVQGVNGSSKVRPQIIGTSALFVQDIGREVRSLKYDFGSDAFGGIDLSARSSHLFQRTKTIVEWAYQRTPHSILWAILSDGNLVALTFQEEQKVYAWHRHVSDGTFESVTTIREGDETAVYLVVKRSIGGVQRKFVERLASFEFGDVENAHFVDCGLTYDGRNTGTTTVTALNGTTWGVGDTVMLWSSTAIFIPSDVDNEIVYVQDAVLDDEGNIVTPRKDYHMRILSYGDPQTVTAVLDQTLPPAYRSAARTDWRFARDTFYGLDHIEGKAVSVLADGNVVDGLSISGGKVDLPTPAAVVHIGLPYGGQIETLDIAYPSGQTKAKTLNVPRVFVTSETTRSLEVTFDRGRRWEPWSYRPVDIGYDAPIPVTNDMYEIPLDSSWTNRGRLAIRQEDPLPMTVTCITPEVIGGKN